MKRKLLSIITILTCVAVWGNVSINKTNFPDDYFRKWLLNQSYGADGLLTDTEIAVVKSINVSGTNTEKGNIKSLKGIEYFIALKVLSCKDNQITSLDITKNTQLLFLYCDGNQLTSLSVAKNIALKELSCSYNQITSLDLTKNSKLQNLDCYENRLTSLDVTKNTALIRLDCHENVLTSLKISGCIALTKLLCHQNLLSSLNVSGFTALTQLVCYNNMLTSLNTSGCAALTQLECYDNLLKSLNISGCTTLTQMDCWHNQLHGAAMDAIIKNLPMTSSSKWCVIFYNYEENAMTVKQVNNAKAKGWIPYQYEYGWNEYAGKDPANTDDSSSPFANVGDNQIILGYYVSDKYKESSGSGGSKGGTYKVCIGFEKNAITPFAGNKITHVRFALVNTDITDVKLWIGNNRDAKPSYTQAVSTLSAGWNEIKLDQPFDIKSENVFVGLEYTQANKNYPISCIDDGVEPGSAYFYGPYGDGGEYIWLGHEEQDTSLSLQCLIEGNKIPDYDIHTKSIELEDLFYKKNEAISGYLGIRNWGKKKINRYELTCMVDGTEVDKTTRYISEESLRSREAVGKPFKFIPSNIGTGKHTVTVSVKSINGKAPDFPDDDSKAAEIKVFANDMGRQKVYYECNVATWCPYVIKSLYNWKNMARERDDIAFVFLHASDQLSCETGNSLGTFYRYVPSSNLNRYAEPGISELSYISLDKAKSMPSFANVNISASYNEDNRNLHIRITGERNEDFALLEEYTNLTVLLTEDSVENRQWDGINDKYIFDWKHQAVLRTNVSDTWGDPIDWNGDKYEKEYSITLDNEWENDKMKIVAYLAKPFTGNNINEIYVVNCNDFAVKDADIVSKVVEVTEQERKSHDIYSISGVKIKENATSTQGLPKGTYIVNGKKIIIYK